MFRLSYKVEEGERLKLQSGIKGLIVQSRGCVLALKHSSI